MDASTSGQAAGTGVALILFFIIAVAISGLVTGALARWLLPGPDPMSWPKTILYGIGGSLLGGVLWQLVNSAVALPSATSFIFSVYGFAWATRTCALPIRAVAISSMARVIFIVDCTLLMRLRI